MPTERRRAPEKTGRAPHKKPNAQKAPAKASPKSSRAAKPTKANAAKSTKSTKAAAAKSTAANAARAAKAAKAKRASVATGGLPALPNPDLERWRDQARDLETANAELRNLTQNLDQIVRQRTRALAESEAQLRRQNVELDRLNRMKSEFISIAAHELRTPMTSIVGYLDLIVEGRLGDLPGDLQRPMMSLRRNAHRLRRLIEDMLDVSRIETGRLAIKRQPVALADIVLEVVDEMKPLADQKHQKLMAELSPVPPVEGDSDKLHQVVSNLVANSLKYTPEGGTIKVIVERAPPEVVGDNLAAPQLARLRVWDNGIGIPPGLRTRIFEPFSDVHTAKHHTSDGPDSAGLGLYIARGLVELHAGKIEVSSEEGRYSEFSVLLPLAAAAAH